MRGMQKSKRVTWASDVNLCQVRLFLSEDSPSQVGMGAQEHLQAKTSATSHANAFGYDDNMPPGFEGTQPANQFKNMLTNIPVARWTSPPRFVLDPTWQVVSGEESKEVEIQKQRELRVLEAIYPRLSAIPENPAPVLGVDDCIPNDQDTPLIPLTPLEDDDPAETMLESMTPTSSLPNQHQSLEIRGPSHQIGLSNPSPTGTPASAVRGVEPDVVAAANAALTALMANNQQGNLIDHDLLVKILSDPKMIEQLVANHGASTSTQVAPSISAPSLPTPSVQTRPLSIPQAIPSQRATGISFSHASPPVDRPDPSSGHIGGSAEPISRTATNGPFFPPGRGGAVSNQRPAVPAIPSAPSARVGAPITKDINYYKSLIQQHGGERHETSSPFGGRNNHQIGPSQESLTSKSRESRPKIMKPCLYFNSSRGCRNGANCAYQHDLSSQPRVSGLPEVQGAKRMKMDREITGT